MIPRASCRGRGAAFAKIDWADATLMIPQKVKPKKRSKGFICWKKYHECDVFPPPCLMRCTCHVVSCPPRGPAAVRILFPSRATPASSLASKRHRVCRSGTSGPMVRKGVGPSVDGWELGRMPNGAGSPGPVRPSRPAQLAPGGA